MAVLMEHMLSQFRTFGEKLDSVEEKMDKGFEEVHADISNLKTDLLNLKFENNRDHQQLMQSVKELDTEVVKLKLVK